MSKKLIEKLRKASELGEEVEFSAQEAEQLGAFEETALSEEDAAEANEEQG